MGQFIATILCINDNPDNLEVLKTTLNQQGYQVVAAPSTTSGLIKALSGVFNLVILDVNFTDGSGIDLCKEIRKFDKKLSLLFYTADAQPERIEEGMKAGAQAYLIQPVEPLVLIETVARLLEKTNLR
jgi:two-component system, OmpR family, copper resistance phosphate regulon response regulator CusR